MWLMLFVNWSMANIPKNKILFTNTFLALLKNQQFVDVPVYGLSMFPFFLPGDIVRVEKPNKNLKKGDVIIFVWQGKLILHRLLSVNFEKNIFITKGDGLKNKDKPIKLDDIKAAVCIQHREKRKIRFTNLSYVKMIIATLSPISGFFFMPLAKLWNKIYHS